MKNTLLLAAGLVASAAAAQAAPIVTASDATGATTSPFALTDLGTSSSSGFQSAATFTAADGTVVSFSPDMASPQAGVYAGSTANVSSSPFAGNSLGSASSNYLTAEPSDNVTLAFSSAQSAFSLLWGTVDTFNSLNLQFFNGTTSIGTDTVTGSAVASAAGIPANGTTGAFVTVSDPTLGSFTSVVATSTTQAFEFVPGAASAASVPEPATLALLGFGLLGLGFVQHRRSRG